MSILNELVDKDSNLEEIPYDWISLESDYIQSEDMCLEIYKCENALEQLFSIEKRVEDQYGLLHDMAYDSIKNTTRAIAIKETICSIISPTRLTYEIPSLESIGWYMSDSDLTISLEGVESVLKKIKDFIVNLFNRLIEAVKKFFDWVKGLFGKTKKNNETVKKKAEKKLEIAKKMPESKPTQTIGDEQIQKERGEKKQRLEKIKSKINNKKDSENKDSENKDSENKVIEVVNNEAPLDGPIFKFENILPEGDETNVNAINNRLVNTVNLLSGIFKSVPIWKTKGYLDLANLIEKLTSGFIKSINKDYAINFCKQIVDSSEIAFKEQYNSLAVKADNKVDRDDFLAYLFNVLISDKIIYYAHGTNRWVVREDNNLFIQETKNYVNAVLNEFGFGINDNKDFKPSNPVRYSKSDFIALLTNTILFCDAIENIDFESFMKDSDKILKNARDKYMQLKETKEEILKPDAKIKDYKMYIIQISSQCDYKMHLAGINNQLKVIRLLLASVATYHSIIMQSEDSEFEQLLKQ